MECVVCSSQQENAEPCGQILIFDYLHGVMEAVMTLEHTVGSLREYHRTGLSDGQLGTIESIALPCLLSFTINQSPSPLCAKTSAMK